MSVPRPVPETVQVAMTETAHRARAYFAGMAALLGVLSITGEAGHAPLLLGVVLAVSMLLISAVHLTLPTAAGDTTFDAHRARAPGVILPSSHPNAAGHPRPRAPGAMAVAPV